MLREYDKGEAEWLSKETREAALKEVDDEVAESGSQSDASSLAPFRIVVNAKCQYRQDRNSVVR
jgi:hypothetical protein